MRDSLRSYLYLASFFLLMYLAGRYLLGHVLPFVIGLAIALMIDPLVNLLEDRARLPRGLASALAIFILVSILSLAVFVGLARVTVELAGLLEELPELYAAMRTATEQIIGQVERFVATLPPSAHSAVDDWLRSMYGEIWSLVNGVVTPARTFVFEGLPNFFVVLLVSAVATYFLSRDKQMVGQFILGLAPPGWRPQLMQIQAEVYRATAGLVNAQIFLVFLTTVATVIGLRLLGVKFALTLGTAAGLLDVIPVVGPALIFIPWTVYLVLVGDWSMALWLGGIWALVTSLRSLAQANVIGERIGMHPLATLLSLYLGARFLGAQGLVIGPLVAILLKASVRSGLLPVLHFDQETQPGMHRDT